MLMQVVMWVIFGASLGVAQWITHERGNSPQADLGPPQAWGRLVVRLPEGWEIQERESDRVMVIEGLEEDRARELVIEQRLSRDPGDEDDSDDAAASRSSEKIVFPGLGRSGTLTVTRAVHRMRGGPMIQSEYLRAFVELPDGLSVTVKLEQVGVRIGSADRLLMKEIVENIKPGSGEGGPQAGWVHAKARRPGDSVEVAREGRAVVVEITSANGTGEAVIQRQGSWPHKLVVRLKNLDRLDRFTISNGRVLLSTGLGQDEPKLRLVSDGNSSLMPFDPNYATVVRRKDDALEVTVPPTMYAGAVRELTVSWADVVNE